MDSAYSLELDWLFLHETEETLNKERWSVFAMGKIKIWLKIKLELYWNNNNRNHA